MKNLPRDPKEAIRQIRAAIDQAENAYESDKKSVYLRAMKRIIGVAEYSMYQTIR